jgi:hypothetical protein
MRFRGNADKPPRMLNNGRREAPLRQNVKRRAFPLNTHCRFHEIGENSSRLKKANPLQGGDAKPPVLGRELRQG